MVDRKFEKVAIVRAENIDILRARGFRCFSVNIENGKVPLADESADMVTALELIEHIKNKAHLIGEASRMLRKGGKFLITTPDSSNWV